MKKNLYSWGLLLIYKICLDITYPLINKTFLYNYFNPINYSFFKTVESYFLLGILTFLILKIKNIIVRELILILFILNFVPITTIYSFLNESRIYIYISFFSYISTLFSYSILNKSKTFNCGKKRINKQKLDKTINFLAIVTAIMVILLLFLKFDFPNIWKSFSTAGLYEIRKTNKLGGVLAYLFTFFIYFSMPFLLNYNFRKNKILLILTIIFVIVVYVYVPKKIILAYLLINLFFIIKIKKLNFSNYLLFVSSSFLILTLKLKQIFFIGMSDRTFYLPAELSFKYYDFFSNNTYNLFNNSKIGIFFPKISDYGMEYTFYISKVYYKSNMNANANYIASSYAEGGIIVVIITSIILGWIMSIIAQASFKLNEKLIFIMVLPNILMLTNGPIWLLFLTNGFLITLLYFIMYSTEGEKRRQNAKIII